MSRRVVLVVLAALAVVMPSVAAAAAPAPSAGSATSTTSSPPIGGEQLGSNGVVVDPLPGAPRLPAGITASSWLVADLGTGDVLAARAPHAKHLPASTLKILTALTLIPRLSPTTQVTVSRADVAVDGSKVGLVPNATYTVAQLFTALLVVSGNDAANALASAAGGAASTLARMNAEARQLQADDTVAKTPSGLDGPGESSSAYDLALIARAAMKLPDFRSYVRTVHAKIGAPGQRYFSIYTHNRLLTDYPGTIGVKNGYTIAAQATYVGAATRNGHTLVVTLMHGQPRFWHDAEPLLDWGFAALGKVSPVGQLVDPLPAPQNGQRSGVADTAARGALRAAKPVATSGGSGVSPMTLGFAGVSALVMVVVTARRRRRARRRVVRPRHL